VKHRFILVAIPAVYAVGAGILGVRFLQPKPVPPESARWVEVPGRIVAMQPRACGTHSRRGTCYRAVAEYRVDGETRQVGTRAIYRSPSVGTGDAVVVLHDAAKTAEAWLQFEYEADRKGKERDRRKERWSDIVWAVLWLGSAALSGLVSVGVLFAKGPDQVQTSSSPPSGTTTRTSPP
jgi:hypothetical protein